MARDNVLQPIFKSYLQKQTCLLPLSLEELIPTNQRVRVVNEVLNKIDINHYYVNIKQLAVAVIIH